MAELVDAPVLGTGFARSEGSSPFIRILKTEKVTSAEVTFSILTIYLLSKIALTT
jgi:hypothetical protein